MRRNRVLVTGLVLTALILTCAPLAVVAQGATVYVVQPGDTATSIASRYCMGAQELLSLNGWNTANANQIYAGAQVQVINRCSGAAASGPSSYDAAGYGAAGPYWPGNCGWGGVYDRGPRAHAQGYLYGNVYVVVRGDTAFSVAQRFGTTVSAIAQANGINPWYIYPGQRLKIPGGGGWCPPQPPCYGNYGYGCPPSYPLPPVYPAPPVYAAPITPVPPPPVVQPGIQIISPAANTVLPATFTVTGQAQGLSTPNLIVRAQTSGGTVLVQQPVTVQGGGAGAFSAQITVNVPAPTPGFIVAYAPQSPAAPAVSVAVTFSPAIGEPDSLEERTYTGAQCVVIVKSGEPFYGEVGGAATGSFSAVGPFTATRGAKYDNQLWVEIGAALSSGTPVWTPETGVSTLSPTCYW